MQHYQAVASTSSPLIMPVGTRVQQYVVESNLANWNASITCHVAQKVRKTE